MRKIVSAIVVALSTASGASAQSKIVVWTNEKVRKQSTFFCND